MAEYNSQLHDDSIQCPNCGRKNAPKDSSSYDPTCYYCNESLQKAPVEMGEEVIVHIHDLHESGQGVGETEEGYIVLVPGELPEKTMKVEITEINKTSAVGEPIEEVETDMFQNEEESEEEEETKSPYNRGNHWG